MKFSEAIEKCVNDKLKMRCKKWCQGAYIYFDEKETQVIVFVDCNGESYVFNIGRFSVNCEWEEK